MHLRQRSCSHVIVECINHIERCNEIERLGRKGKSERRCPRHQPFAMAAGIGETAERQVDSNCAPISAKHSKVVASSAATIEDRQVGSTGRCAFQQRDDEAPEAAEPEMPAFGARRRIEQSIHRVSRSGRGSCYGVVCRR